MEGLLVGLAVMAIFVILGTLVLGGLSKITGDKISYRGNIVATPTSLNEQADAIKKGSLKIKDFTVKKSNELIKQIETLKSHKVDKSERIEKLAELRRKDFISEEEYHSLKKEIIEEK